MESRVSEQPVIIRAIIRVAVIVALVSIVSCATQDTVTSQLSTKRVTRDALLYGGPFAEGTELPPVEDVDVLELTPEMKRFLDDHVRSRGNESGRLRMLLFAVMGEGSFQLIYEESTRTAAETFRDQRGNCLSFTNMFIAMARYLDLDAYYQEIEIPPDWSLSGQSFLLSEHVNVEIKLSNNEERIVDFNMYDFKLGYDRKVISDKRARAHYFNNLGAEFMLDGDVLSALSYLRQSLLEDGSFAPAWVNMGILYRREGYPRYAEAAYLIALEADRYNLVAMSNLANLYEQQGIIEAAETYRTKVKRHRMENPYYRYLLAKEAMTSGDYDTAISNLDYAIKKRPDEDAFLYLKSTTYLMMGDREKAEKWMKRARNVALEDADKNRYSHKLQLLRSQGDDR